MLTKFYMLLKSYLTDHRFYIWQEDAGVPQGGMLGLVLYLLYIHADNTALSETTNTFDESTGIFRHTLNKITNRTKKLRIKLNVINSRHIHFTNQKITKGPFLSMTYVYEGTRKEERLRNVYDFSEYLGGLSEKDTTRYPFTNNPTTSLDMASKFGDAPNTLIISKLFRIKLYIKSLMHPSNIRATDLHRDLSVDIVADFIEKHAHSYENRLKSHID